MASEFEQKPVAIYQNDCSVTYLFDGRGDTSVRAAGANSMSNTEKQEFLQLVLKHEKEPGILEWARLRLEKLLRQRSGQQP